MRAHLVQWQWSDYGMKHRNRANLLLHIIAVPMFDAALLIAIYTLIRGEFALAGVAFAAMIFSMAAQGRGHKGEKNSPAPFEGPLDFPARFLAEQWITFPRFVLCGGWYGNLKRADPE